MKNGVRIINILLLRLRRIFSTECGKNSTPWNAIDKVMGLWKNPYHNSFFFFVYFLFTLYGDTDVIPRWGLIKSRSCSFVCFLRQFPFKAIYFELFLFQSPIRNYSFRLSRTSTYWWWRILCPLTNNKFWSGFCCSIENGDNLLISLSIGNLKYLCIKSWRLPKNSF